MKDEIRLLKRQNEGYKASAKQASEVLEQDISNCSMSFSWLFMENIPGVFLKVVDIEIIDLHIWCR